MNSHQKALYSAFSQKGKLELISKGTNQLRAIYDGKHYDDYFDLPVSARYAVARCTTSFYDVYTELRKEYSADEAELRIAWCLFGSLDSNVDIDINERTGKVESSIEISSHCSKCQYARPFCKQYLPHLSRREQECFLLMRQGLTDKEVGAKLGISYTTVIKHFQNAVERYRDITGRQITRQYILTLLAEAGA